MFTTINTKLNMLSDNVIIKDKCFMCLNLIYYCFVRHEWARVPEGQLLSVHEWSSHRYRFVSAKLKLIC